MKKTNSGHFPQKLIPVALFFLLFWNGALEARIVASPEAQIAAERLLEMENKRPELRLNQNSFQLDNVEPLFHHDWVVAYLVKLKPQGFMILSDITEVSPQVFVSFSGDFETLRTHPFLIYILDQLEYNKVQLRYLEPAISQRLVLDPKDTPDSVQIELNELSWSTLLNNTIPVAGRMADSLSASAVVPLLKSRWNQNSPYWNYTPRVNGVPTYTGCGATAMAQVMYYWKHPQQGQGSNSYLWNGRTLSANFDHQYFWDQMRSDYSGGYSAAAADAVARLMSDVGIAINMGYGTEGSSSGLNSNDAFSAFFKYSPEVHSVAREDFADWSTWFNIIKQQLEIRQPVILIIYKPSLVHYAVGDGYRTSPSNQVHVNMGWGGYTDTYYSLANIYGYSNTAALIDIRPTRIRLTLQTSVGGTTNPAPGIYDYGDGTEEIEKIVHVTALPETHFQFLNWTGDATGTQNPVTITVNGEKTVKANFQRIIYAPANAVGQRVMNRSLSLREYINILSWQANPANNDLAITKYRIYVMDGATAIQLIEINGDLLTYSHRRVKNQAANYRITAVLADGREGMSAQVTIQ